MKPMRFWLFIIVVTFYSVFVRGTDLRYVEETIISVRERLNRMKEERVKAEEAQKSEPIRAPASEPFIPVKETEIQKPVLPKSEEVKKVKIDKAVKKKRKSKSPKVKNIKEKKTIKETAKEKPTRVIAVEKTTVAPVVPTETNPTAPQAEDFNTTRISKGWNGKRKNLLEQGVDLSFVYKAEQGKVFSGGVDKSKVVFLDNFDFKIGIDAEKLVGWQGGSFYFYALANQGDDPSTLVGDAQGTSNIETSVNSMKSYETWIQQSVFKDTVSLLIGIHDLNSEFYNTETSGLFFNATFGVGKEFSQTGERGPSIFPQAAAAIRLKIEPSKSFYLQSAVFNAVAGYPYVSRGNMQISEFAYVRGKEDTKQRPAKYAIGTWAYSQPFSQIYNTALQGINRGSYLLIDQTISDSAAIFLRYGIASPSVNRFSSSVSSGIVFSGIIPNRDKDKFGFGIAQASNGDDYIASRKLLSENPTNQETTYEFNYRLEAFQGIAIQPDFQYIVSPNTDPTIGHCFVGSIRMEFNF